MVIRYTRPPQARLGAPGVGLGVNAAVFSILLRFHQHADQIRHPRTLMVTVPFEVRAARE